MAFIHSIWFSLGISTLILVSPFFLRKKQSLSSLSGLTTTFGILGTFIGIFLGLIAFQTTDIEGSVPVLLEGLKTAFLTSIAGMIAGILLKLFPGIYGIQLQTDNTKEGTEAVVSLLSELKDINRAQMHNQSILLKNIEKALCGDGDSTVLTQLQKIRTNFSDKQDELIKEFRAFASTMAENNSKALIDALTEVMKDFNAKINEQFGENFKHLNQAVEKILIWQEKYKEQVEQMIISFDRSLQGVEQSEQNLALINEHADEFVTIAESLERVILDLDKQRNAVQERLQDFAEVGKEARRLGKIWFSVNTFRLRAYISAMRAASVMRKSLSFSLSKTTVPCL